MKIDKNFFLHMEKKASPVGLLFAGMTAQGLLSDSSLNKARVRLADPKMPQGAGSTSAYGYQFNNPFSARNTPTRSLFD